MPRPTVKTDSSGFVLLSTSTTIFRHRACLGRLNEPEPDSVVIESTKKFPTAAVAFKPEELDARLKRMARRAAAKLPITGKGSPFKR